MMMSIIVYVFGGEKRKMAILVQLFNRAWVIRYSKSLYVVFYIQHSLKYLLKLDETKDNNILKLFLKHSTSIDGFVSVQKANFTWRC